MIVCEIDGVIAGNCQINFKTKLKNKHRALIAIGLLKPYWGLGNGTQMMLALEIVAKNNGIKQLELEVIEGNHIAIGLYEKMGFVKVAEKLNAIILKDGTSLKEYYMIKVIG